MRIRLAKIGICLHSGVTAVKTYRPYDISIVKPLKSEIALSICGRPALNSEVQSNTT
jgi:hypothetical protein